MLKAGLLEEVQRDINFAMQRKEVGHQSYLSCHKYYVPRKVQPFAKSLRPCSSSSCKFPHEQPFTGLPRAGHDDISTRTYSVSGTDTRSIHSIQLIMKAAPIAAFLKAPPVLPHDFCCRVTAVGCPDKSWRSAHRDNKPHSNPRNLKPTASREVNFPYPMCDGIIRPSSRTYLCTFSNPSTITDAVLPGCRIPLPRLRQPGHGLGIEFRKGVGRLCFPEPRL